MGRNLSLSQKEKLFSKFVTAWWMRKLIRRFNTYKWKNQALRWSRNNAINTLVIKLLLPEHFRLRASSVAITWIIRPMRSLSISMKRLGCDRTYIAKYIIISCKDKSIRAPTQSGSSWLPQSQRKHCCHTGHSCKNPFCPCWIPVSGLQYWCLGRSLHK